ncbi:MAG: lipoprotein [Chitinophagaceae bacterium]
MRKIIFLVGTILVLAACNKGKENESTGEVVEKKGCYPDSYLVKLTNPGNPEASFVCPQTTPVATEYNCTNAVFIHLPLELGIPGKKIRFVFSREEVSCLSYTNSPRHIIVKSVRAD